MSKSKGVIVTGGTGFVGANLVRRLLREGHVVHLLVRGAHNPWRIESIRRDVQIHVIDFQDEPGLTKTIGQIRPEWVFHLAAYGAYPDQKELARMVQTNIVGTMNLVRACLHTGCEVVVNTGSSSEYGFKDHAPREQEWLEPNSHYAVTKASATMFCRYTAQTCRVPIPTLRLYSVFGPFEQPGRLIPTLVLRGLTGALPPLVNPDIARDFLYVEDAVEAYLAAATKCKSDFGAVYNVGAGMQMSIADVVQIARERLNICAEPEWGTLPSRSWDTTCWVADINAIRADLAWQPARSLAEGFGETVAWFRSHPELWTLYDLP